MTPRPVAITELIDRYDGILLDAYGVLVDARGILPGAAELLAELDRRGRAWAIVSNDASRSQATYARRFAGYGARVPEANVVTSGSLLPPYFRAHGLVGARTFVLGTEDSAAYVVEGGGVPVAVTHAPDVERGGEHPRVEIDALAICDDSGFDFLPGVESAFNAVVRAVEAGRTPALILPNPDLVYPKGDGELGFTSGTIALMIEAALARRFPAKRLAFARLGKPEPHLFLEAARRLAIAPDRLVMIGDQLETDIAGARAAGLHAALLAGVSRWEHAHETSSVVPEYLVTTLAP